jgi:peptide/nickel transport system substrate-binding protein
MTSASIFRPFTSRKRSAAVVAGVAAVALALTGCAAGSSGGASGGGGSTITVGTTDPVTALDPAGSYDNGSQTMQQQVFAYLVNTPYGSPDVAPDLAETAEFTGPAEYTVKLKKGLKFANGDKLTSSDVKFSFDRQLKIADPNGPSSLLYNLDSVATPDDLTAVFTLKTANDQVFPQILSSFPGAIVDEDVFSPDKVTPDKDIVKANAFEGQYVIKSYDFNNLVQLEKNPDYAGFLPEAENGTVNVKYYTDSSNLKLDIQKNNIDVAFRSISATDTEDLRKNKKVKVWDGPGGEIRYIVFNFNTQPYGATTADANPAKALAVRQAVADLVDRQEIATQVYKDTYTPLYSYVAQGLTGATDVLKGLYGDGQGGPDAAKAKAALEAAGVTVPVKLQLQYAGGDHYGPSSADEYGLVKDQLEAGGLFSVDLQSTDYVQYSKDRVADLYPAYQLGWFPDYSDADNYLTPFFLTKNFLSNHYDNKAVNDEILEQAVTVDPAARQALIEKIQQDVAADLSTVPLLQGAQVAVSGTDISGLTLDASFKFRFGALKKG